MSTLTPGTALGRVARILHAARALGAFAWGDVGGSGGGALPGGVGAGGEAELTRDLLELFSLLRERGVARLLVGGIALLKYVDGRNTDDVDLLMSAPGLARVPELVVADRNGDFARAGFRGLRVDVLFTENPLFALVLAGHATTHRFSEVEVPVATASGLVILKLYALPAVYQQGDLQRAALYETDIAMLCQRCDLMLGPLLEVVRPYVAGPQFGELARIASEIEARVARMKGQRGA